MFIKHLYNIENLRCRGQDDCYGFSNNPRQLIDIDNIDTEGEDNTWGIIKKEINEIFRDQKLIKEGSKKEDSKPWEKIYNLTFKYGRDLSSKNRELIKGCDFAIQKCKIAREEEVSISHLEIAVVPINKEEVGVHLYLNNLNKL